MSTGGKVGFPVVCLCCPAGDCGSLLQLVGAIPSDSGLCYVVVQDNAPERSPLTDQLAAARCSIPVVAVRDGEKPEPNRIYILLPGSPVVLVGNRFLVQNDREEGPLAGPVDRLLISLAETGRQVFSVVLTGALTDVESDGARGLKAVRVAGGTVIMQQGGDNSRIRELADFIMQPESIPAKLVNIARQHEINRQKELERNLADCEQRLKQALETSRLGVFEIDLVTGKAISSNRHDEILGHVEPLTDYTLKKGLSHVHPDDSDFVTREINTAMARASPREMEFRICTPDNELRWAKSNVEVCYNEFGNTVKLIGTLEDITARKSGEVRQKLMMAELQHRVKNTLASILAIVRFTARNSTSIEEMTESLTRRLESISNTHNVLTDANWSTVGLRDILTSEIAPYSQGGATRFVFEGTNLSLAPKDALAIAMAIHELSTNSAKYGALAAQEGFIKIKVVRDRLDGECTISWKEKNGPQVKNPGTKSGFGSFLLETALAQQIEGTTKLAFEPDGLHYEIRFTPKSNDTDLGSPPHGV